MSPLNLNDSMLPEHEGAAAARARTVLCLLAVGGAAVVATLAALHLAAWSAIAAVSVMAALAAQALWMQRDAVQQAERSAAESKARFLSVISHELRTPLNGILGFSDLLAEEVAPASRQAEFVQSIRESGGYLLNQINEVLELNSLEAGRVALQPGELDPAALLAKLEGTWRREAALRTSVLRSRPDLALPRRLRCDPERLERVLGLLLRYAISTGVRAEITLESWLAPGAVHFAVRSNAFQLTDAECASLFEKFAHFDDSATRRTTGFGLGLAIAWRMAQLMGAQLSVSSGAAGTSLELRLPHYA